MKKLIVELIVIFGIVFIAACGGGGSGGSNSGSDTPTTAIDNETIVTDEQLSEETVIEYQPDESLLYSDAGASTELYVRSGFRFTNYRSVHFVFTALGQNNGFIRNAVLKISSLPDGVMDLNDQRLVQRELLTVIKTDNNGQAYQTLELPRNISSVLVELNTIGIENAVILSVEGADTITHNFL